MDTFRSTILALLLSAGSVLAGEGQSKPVSLDSARDQGRQKSRFLKETKDSDKTSEALPKANLAFFQKSVMPLLNKSCLNCHGPKKSEGR